MIKGILIQRRGQEDASYSKQLKMEHADLIAEMQTVENLPTHERLQLARHRRAQQLKLARQKEKEWAKLQRSKGNGSVNLTASHQLDINGSEEDRGDGFTHTTHYFRNDNGGSTTSGRRHISFENSVVLLEAASRNDMQEVATLLRNGITPDAANEDGLTALHQCCIDNNVDMLRLLLEYGANVDAQDSDKWTPLHAAATCGHLELVRILIRNNANLLAVNTDGNMPYDLCDDESTLDFIEGEMAQRGVTQELIDETRSSTEQLMLRDLIELMRTGGDLEEPDYQGATPLHIAAANGYVRVVESLLEQHVNVDAMDKDLWTPVHAAACWGHLEVLEMLAQCGADLNVKNKDNETPSDICEDPEIRERIELLKTEQESKRLAEAQRRRVRRSQSNNTRAQSVRRTSLRDKTLTTKKDAVEEARLRLQAQEATDTAIALASINGEIINGYVGHENKIDSKIKSEKQPITASLNSVQLLPLSNSADAVDSITTNISSKQHSYLSRRPPEGRENDYLELKKVGVSGGGSSTDILLSDNVSSTAANAETVKVQSSKETGNGKINVQVTVLVDTISTQNHQQIQQHQQSSEITLDNYSAATLSNLKKQRSLSRTANVLNNFEIVPRLAQQHHPTHIAITNGSVLGSVTTVNNNNNSTNNNNNNSANGDLVSPIATEPLRMGSAVGSTIPSQLDFELIAVSDTSATVNSSVNKFSGVTGDMVSDSTSSSRKCCTIM